MKQLIFPGNYHVGKEKDLVLEACLGSCVGVIICDKEAKVGGLIHLLLSEQTGGGRKAKPELYAKTGLPVFIDALCMAGAEKSRMEAFVAGGALVGQVSQVDLDLDIGGRTAEMTKEILANKSIRISRSETGGHFGYRLSLDLKSFKSSIDLTAQAPDKKNCEVRKLTQKDLMKSIGKVRPIPQIALKIIRMIGEENYNMNEVADEIKKDQIIAAGIIKLCNSSYFRLNNKIDTVERALIVLGEKRLFQMIVSVSLKDSFSGAKNGYSLCKGGLFQHSIGTAVISEEIAKYTGVVDPPLAYTAGLLHDIGKIVLDQHISSNYPFFYRFTQIEKAELSEAERETTGFTHTEAGGLLGETWSLNERLTDTIRNHHQPELSSVDPKLTHIVYLADLITGRFQAGKELGFINKGDIASRLKKIGLTPSQLSSMVDLIPQKILEGAIE